MLYWVTAVVTAVTAVTAVTGAPPPMDEDMAELARMVRDSCLAESGVEPALLERVNGGEPLMEDAALKCYARCVMETAGMMSEGEVHVDVVLALLDDATRARSEAALRTCGTRTGLDACDTAWRTQRCWQEANPRDYYLI